MPGERYLEVAALPHYDSDSKTWSLVRFFIDGEWRRLVHPKAEYARMIKGFG